MTTGTHWPELRLGPAVPASDKLIHTLAFAGLTFLLWRTGWVRWRWLLLVIGLTWAVVDELSQAIPGLNRFITLADMSASALGVAMVVLWLWAIGPVGDGGSQRRLDAAWTSFDELFARGGTWLIFIVHFIACVAPVFVVRAMATDETVATSVIIAAAAWCASGIAILAGLWSQEARRLRNARACLECAAPQTGVDTGRPRWTCSRCDADVRRGDWTPGRIDRPPLRWREVLAMAAPPVVLAGLVLALLATIGWADIDVRPAPRLARMPREFILSIDIALVTIPFAVWLRWMRRRAARREDQHECCRHCGHDLIGTPTADGVGRCGECGMTFADPEAIAT